MKVRSIAAVVAGMAAWQAMFMVLGICCGIVWPEYAAAARTFFDTSDFSQFTIPMMLTNFVVFALTGAGCGWLAARIAGSRKPAMLLAGLIFAYAAFQHFYLEWGNLPDWYNLVVPWIIGGSIVLGGRLHRHRHPSIHAHFKKS